MTRSQKIFLTWILAIVAVVAFGTIVQARISNPGASSSTSASAAGADPTGTIGLAAVNGVATTFLRSDASQALDVTIAPTWTGLHTFTKKITAGAASTTDVTISNSFGIPSTGTAAPTFAGELRISTASDQLKFFGTVARVLTPFGSAGFQYPATSTAGLAGTTTQPLPVAAVNGQWDGAYCYTDQGIWNVVFSAGGSASTTMIQASSTPGFISFAANNTFTAGQKRYISIASTTQASAAPSILTCTLRSQVTGS